MPLTFLSILIYGSLACASKVDDFCSNDIPCEPSDVDSFFCDFQIGPTAGGYCVACEGRQTYFCSSDDIGLTDVGELDCQNKCSLTSCAGPCEDGYFCSFSNYQDGPCQPCESLIVHPEECKVHSSHPDEGIEACVQTCPPRSCSKRRHCLSIDATTKYFCNFAQESVDGEEEPMGTCEPCSGLKSTEECSDRASSDFGSQECAEVCGDDIVTTCNTNDDCAKDRFFCNTTHCEACPTTLYDPEWHVDKCFDDDDKIHPWPDEVSQNCAAKCHTECFEEMEGSISVQGLIDIGKDSNIPMMGTPYVSVSGPLVDCQLGGSGECSADAPDNFVCLVSRGVRKFSDIVLNCEESGGVATILYNNEESGSIVEGFVGDAPIEIPVTAISLQDGLHLLENALGLEVKVETKNLGDKCDRGCSDSVPCPSSPGSWYCDYQLGTHGYCKECGLDEDRQRVECFLSGLPLSGAQECASTCESTLASPSCKICGKGVSGSSLQSAAEGEARCTFCPDGLKRTHFEREIPFIGSNATCFKLNQFFLNYPVSESDPNCQLALNFNYICDCEGPGYAGADTEEKRNVLIWLPRVSAIISFLSSFSIIVDVVRDKKKRAKVYGQLMLAMSIFDLMGSAAYSLTTLPIPTEYYVEGAKGNGATCIAQGFFIQMGTTSAFINVSLAVYYYCMIRLSWPESKIAKMRLWLFLCPVTVGLVFAFAGIPFYDMLFLWCNNSAPWWPEIPIIAAILVTTLTMVGICLKVYKTEKASRQYTTRRTSGQSMSSVVFWQSIWYLLSFYLTWPPYLALQYLWAAGSYPPFGFVLFACALVPLQGFWNCVVFFRIRAKRAIHERISHLSSNLSRVTSGHPVFFSRKGSNADEQEGSAAVIDAEWTNPSVLMTSVVDPRAASGLQSHQTKNPGEISAQRSCDSIYADAVKHQVPASEDICLGNGWVGSYTNNSHEQGK